MNAPVLDDAVLPAAAYLTSRAASDVLGAAIAAGGGELRWSEPNGVQYRPGSDLVVRYKAEVVHPDGRVAVETLVAATTVHGPPPGTVPVEAELDDGEVLRVGVWRWPFDPVLVGLEAAVVPEQAQRRLGGLVGGPVELEVVAYRPCERTVVRVVDGDRELYVKVVPPDQVAALAERHRALGAAGVPVPEVLIADDSTGWIAMTALGGPTLRERLKAGARPWPDAAAFTRLARQFAAADLAHVAPVRPRVLDASGHAAMLAVVLGRQKARLDELAARFRGAEERVRARCGAIIHGDLYEAQLVLDGDRISGVLDIDDAGPGDPLDDAANLLGHLAYRATTTADPALAGEIGDYALALRRRFAAADDPAELDEAIAAVLVGLATGPYRIQQAGWERIVDIQLDIAERLLDGGGDERSLRIGSSPSQTDPAR
jgi:aminoglycoside phosphotransferase (APT) family kinase protein